MTNDSTEDKKLQFISHPNTRTLHIGTRERGAECGQVSQEGWASVDATNQLDAVLNYATQPCRKCFTHGYHDLHRIYLKEHTSILVEKPLDELTKTLPWELSEVINND